nr:hypothetical protein [uncultured Gellertiella sp.]
MALNAGMPDTILIFAIAQTDLVANTGHEIVSPVDGYIYELRTIVQDAITTGGTVTVKTGDALANTVAGLSVAIASAAAKGVRAVGTPTPKSTTRKVSKGDRIQIATANFATAGSIRGYLKIAAADTDGVMPF